MNTRPEANFDGLVGPTHHYAGLSTGNIASVNHKRSISNPKAAALQGLEKMWAMHQAGFIQGVLPPHERPNIHILRRLGFTGSDEAILKVCGDHSLDLLAACSSASSMWAANAATVSPSADTSDGRIHFTSANLCNKFHRSIEPNITKNILKATFPSEHYFAHHSALPASDMLGDEGAANHTRLCHDYYHSGIELFVYGRTGLEHQSNKPTRYPARQTLEASQAIARLHQLNPQRTLFVQQNPKVIDHGVFHNDVIAVGNQNVLFCHELAFLDQAKLYQEIKKIYSHDDFTVIEVLNSEVSVRSAVDSYLFNSQLLTLTNGEMCLIVPSNCFENRETEHYLERLIKADNPITAIKPFDLRQSMNNGGGPACLRLRVVLTPEERAAVNPSTLLTDALYTQLTQWIKRHFRDQLTLDDLTDPALLEESRTALDELTSLLNLGAIYHFQQTMS